MIDHKKSGELARIVKRLLVKQDEVVLATEELQTFLGNGKPLDSVATMVAVRHIADENRWTSFVFDYGALVRFEPRTKARKAARANGQPRHAPRSSA
jgi:hypothetical protein